jgi:hypothetical protein
MDSFRCGSLPRLTGRGNCSGSGCSCCNVPTRRYWRNMCRRRKLHIFHCISIVRLRRRRSRGDKWRGVCSWRLQFPYFVCCGPFDPLELLEVHVLLLRADDAAGSDDAHEGDGLIGRETVFPDEIRADECTGSAKACLTLRARGEVSHDVLELSRHPHEPRQHPHFR